MHRLAILDSWGGAGITYVRPPSLSLLCALQLRKRCRAMSSEGKRSPHPGGSHKGNALLPAFVISPLGAEGSVERARAEFLETQIAAALAEKRFEPKLITSTGGKERITEAMIERLTEEPLAIAIMDGFNRNVMYEIAIRHSLCLPTVHLIEGPFKGTPPFDLHDIELVNYPRIHRRGLVHFWSPAQTRGFRVKLQQRVGDQMKGSKTAMFSKGLRKASALGILSAVFDQKNRELHLLIRQLRSNIDHIKHDYPHGDDAMEGARGKYHAELLAPKYDQIHIASDTLLDLVENAELAAAQSEKCIKICGQISEVIEKLASVIQSLKVAGTKSARSRGLPGPPLCKTVLATLKKIIAQSQKLRSQIAALHRSENS